MTKHNHRTSDTNSIASLLLLAFAFIKTLAKLQKSSLSSINELINDENIDSLVQETLKNQIPCVHLLDINDVMLMTKCKKTKWYDGMATGIHPQSIPKTDGQREALWDARIIHEFLELKIAGKIVPGYYHSNSQSPNLAEGE